MDWLESKQLVLDLMQSPQTISSLVTKTGGIKELVKFFDWMCDDFQMIFPFMLQGDDDPDHEDIFQDQPVVWDGGFGLDDKGELVYIGYAGASGFGGVVMRTVKVTDQVMAG